MAVQFQQLLIGEVQFILKNFIYLKFGNLTKEFKKREKKKTIDIKRKWAFYNDLMEYIHNYADIR